jgi:hypothetical protein
MSDLTFVSSTSVCDPVRSRKELVFVYEEDREWLEVGSLVFEEKSDLSIRTYSLGHTTDDGVSVTSVTVTWTLKLHGRPK